MSKVALTNVYAYVLNNVVLLDLQEEYGPINPGDRTPSELYKIPPGLPPPATIPLKHDYCFDHGRHSGSFYLKLGAAGERLDYISVVVGLRTCESMKAL